MKKSSLMIKKMIFMLFLFSMFSCRELVTYDTKNAFSKLFKVEVEGRGHRVITMDDNGSVLSELNFSTVYKRVVLLNTTYLSYVSSLSKENNVVGVLDLDRVKSGGEAFKKLDNKIVNVGKNGILNIELIESLRPDLIICNSFQFEDLSLFEGVDILVANEFWESHPLGRVEWVRVFGVLFGVGEEANLLFSKIVDRYNNRLIKNHESIPAVYSLSRFSSDYFLPGCESLVSQLLTDAQSKVECIKETSRSVQISQEKQLSMCGDKDYLLFFDWLLKERGREEVLKELSIETCFKGDVIYCNTSSNNYFESSIMEPDVVVGDLIQILHQGEEETKYFKLLKE